MQPLSRQKKGMAAKNSGRAAPTWNLSCLDLVKALSRKAFVSESHPEFSESRMKSRSEFSEIMLKSRSVFSEIMYHHDEEILWKKRI